ncbi:DUF3139 domain-containing protein [Brevibacillus sp. SYP-B805]|uniref:DUF3139 domain-containing protein n=1 Tax=Brevibacillus sp. SYP-B805 TaxID=1578199 RepID=UPI0013EB18F6|nr:DUF3139 domain-containing protein [Brevibacillus sp. SYP-B805]
MKKKIAFISVWVVILIAIAFSPFLYVQVNKMIYVNRVTTYLLEEEGYKKEDIKSIEGVWNIKLPPFYVVVVFKDEPYVQYIYFAHNEVMQFEHKITEEGKQKGITEENLKHVVQ